MKVPGLKGNLIPRRSPNSPLSKQNLEPRESTIDEIEMDSYAQSTTPEISLVGPPVYVSGQPLSLERYFDSNLTVNDYSLYIPPALLRWILDTYAPLWLQPLNEPVGSTQTTGLAGPDSTGIINVTFGEPGLVDHPRTAAYFNDSSIVFPTDDIFERLHKEIGGTFLFWAKYDLAEDDAFVVFNTGGDATLQTGFSILLENRISVKPYFINCFRIQITKSSSGKTVYSNLVGDDVRYGAMTAPGTVTPGVTQMFTVTHSLADGLKIYIDGIEALSVSLSEAYSPNSSSRAPTIGARSHGDFFTSKSSTLQGLTIIPDILTPTQIYEIYDRSLGSRSVRWEPVDYAAWYAADHFETLLESSVPGSNPASPSSPVGRWVDLGGNPLADGRQSTTSLQPIRSVYNGRPSLFFDGDRLICENFDIIRNLENFAIFAVFTPTAPVTNSHVVWYASTSGSADLFRASVGARNAGSTYAAGGRRLDGDSFSSIEVGSVSYDNLVAQITDFRHGEDTLDMYLSNDGISPSGTISPFKGLGPVADTNSVAISIGGGSTGTNWNMRGHIHELIIYRRRPTQAEREAFMIHARDYWGATLG